MENLKIKVNSEAEIKEVQGLFDKLDLVCETWSSKMNLPFFICNWIDGEYSNYSLQDSGLNHLSESSIQQLRDMVVLKRNDDKTEAFNTKEMCKGGSSSIDNVNHPSHYCGHPSGIECIEITRHHDFAIGNAIKYLWRAGLKYSDNEVQDLKKAVWYIQDKIKQLESKNVDDKTIDWINEGNK